VVRLGDLFANAGDSADAVVAYAPPPGKRAVYDARWLYRIARHYGVAWRPLGVQDQAIVERESVLIKVEEIEEQITRELVDSGMRPDMRAELSNRLLRLYVPAESAAAVAVEDVSFDARTQRFQAVVSAPANDPRAQRVRVVGQAVTSTDVPVLARPLRSGDVIGERDVRWMKVRSDRLPRDAITDAKDLIGRTPRQGLRADVPVLAQEVRLPILVERNGLVTIVYKRPNMTLTAQGRALDEGGDGETVRVANTATKTVLEGEVSGPSTVVVRAAGAVAIH
jgi:flagella basal body P-ring formation protein FlgA